MYPKNVVQPAWAPQEEYRRAFRRKWCAPTGSRNASSGDGAAGRGGGPPAVDVSFVDTPRLHAAVIRLASAAGGGILVSFRGTDGLRQRALNQCCWMQPVEPPGGGGGGAACGPQPNVHAAWWASLQEALPRLRGLVHEAFMSGSADGLKGGDNGGGRGGGGGACGTRGPGATPCQPPTRLYFAGHSLGGAFAQLAAALMMAGAPAPVGGVFAFGAPRVGDAGWADRYASALGGVTWAFENAGDGVTSQPPSLPPLLRYERLPSTCLVAVCSPWEDWEAGSSGGPSSGCSCSGRSELGSCGCIIGRAGRGESESDNEGSSGSVSGSSAATESLSCGRYGCGSSQKHTAASPSAKCAAAAGGDDGWPQQPAAAAFAPRLRTSRHSEHAYVDAVTAWAAGLQS